MSFETTGFCSLSRGVALRSLRMPEAAWARDLSLEAT